MRRDVIVGAALVAGIVAAKEYVGLPWRHMWAVPFAVALHAYGHGPEALQRARDAARKAIRR